MHCLERALRDGVRRRNRIYLNSIEVSHKGLQGLLTLQVPQGVTELHQPHYARPVQLRRRTSALLSQFLRFWFANRQTMGAKVT